MASAFDGKWTRASISGTSLTFHSGRNVLIEIINANMFTMELHGEKHTATLEDDGKLHWDDDDVWELTSEYMQIASEKEQVPKTEARQVPTRHDFGMGFGTCALCEAKWVMRRGCKDTERVICSRCWPDYVNRRETDSKVETKMEGENEAERTDMDVNCAQPAAKHGLILQLEDEGKMLQSLELEVKLDELQAENAVLKKMVQERIPLEEHQMLLKRYQALQLEFESYQASVEKERLSRIAAQTEAGSKEEQEIYTTLDTTLDSTGVQQTYDFIGSGDSNAPLGHMNSKKIAVNPPSTKAVQINPTGSSSPRASPINLSQGMNPWVKPRNLIHATHAMRFSAGALTNSLIQSRMHTGPQRFNTLGAGSMKAPFTRMP